MRGKPNTHAPGTRFGRLTIIRADDRTMPGRAVRWIVLCDCGTERSVIGSLLMDGRTKSCGCLSAEQTRMRSTTHGMTGSQEYRIWSTMRDRCSNPNAAGYSRYGGRGITVCPEWQAFDQFISDMGLKPTREHSIDRIDNDGPYAPWNCRWATPAEQARNKRRPIKTLTHNGKTATIAEWARATGLSMATIYSRLDLGWSIEKSLTHPFDASKAHYKRRS